ncbi:unnamed protein product [Ectocarpus sp. 6 AP-2014]
MASAGSFVHGTGASEERLRQSKEEQDIADFMSSIDDTASGGSTITSVLRGGRSSAGNGGDIFLGSLSPPALQQVTGTSAAGELAADDGKAIADAFPADWLNDFEGLGPGVQGKTGSSAAPATAAGQPIHSSPPGQQPQQQQQHQQDEDDQQQQLDAMIQNNKTGEVLGEEPEILDNVDEGYGSGAAAAGMLMSAGGRMVSWAANTPASLVDAATGAFRGDAHHAVSRNARGDLGNGSAAAASTDADELPLDWQGTLDMVGMAEAETDTKGTSALAVAPVSELPSLPPPVAREGGFPDFVEIRDPRNVSQFPKPDNALVAKAAAGGGGDGQAGQGAGDSGEHAAAAGQEHGQRHVLPAPLRTVEVYLRPDVTWESVSDVYMGVMLSRGLVVRHQTEKMVTAEKSADAPGDWATVKLTVGVTRDKLRTLVIQFYADTRKQAPILSLAGTIARFSGRTGDDLYTAIRNVLVERQMPLSFLATDAEEVSLDPHYVRDLVGMYAHENVVNLTRYALPLEEFVRQEEERLARLEATLLPQYRACGLAPPRPTRSKPLSAYPLTTRRPPVSACGVEEAREVMERAREHVRGGGNSFPPQKGVDVDDENVFASGGGGGGGGGGGEGGEGRGAGAGSGSSVAEGIRSLIRATWEDVKEWCDEEAEARVRRKDTQVRDRLLAVEGHREALIAALRDGAGGSAASSTPAGREFAARFRPMAKEAVLCQCKAVHAKRVGQLYLTCNHVCFHSSVLGFTSQRVLPLLTVATISHASSVLGMDLLTLVDRGGQEHSFGITAVEAGFPERFHDLLKQCLVLCKADASRRAAQREGAAASEREPDEEQILARVQRLAKAKQLREAREAASATASRATAATPTAAAAVDMAPPAASPHSRPRYPRPEESEVAERDTGASVGGGVVEGGAGGAMGAGGGFAAAEAGNEGSGGGQDEGAGRGARGGGGRSGSMMAMGIQAFLEESQKRS